MTQLQSKATQSHDRVCNSDSIRLQPGGYKPRELPNTNKLFEPWSETGLAFRFAELYRDKLQFNTAAQQWFSADNQPIPRHKLLIDVAILANDAAKLDRVVSSFRAATLGVPESFDPSKAVGLLTHQSLNGVLTFMEALLAK